MTMFTLFIGIYAGDGKPEDLDTFLGPFVTEMQQLQEGLKITDKSQREKIIHAKLLAFICDSPARAMIKGFYFTNRYRNI